MDKIALTKERLNEVPGVLKSLEIGILNGEIGALNLPIIISAFDKWIKYAKENKELQACVEKDFQNNAEGKTANYEGAKITLNERDSWDFSPCPENEMLISLDFEIDKLKDQRKAIEETLKARYRIDDFVNVQTGEVTGQIKPIKKQTTKYFTVK